METPTPTTAFEAFLKAQSEFKTAAKDSTNPHFRSSYADFASIYDAVSVALHNNWLFVTQPIRISPTGFPVVETIVRFKDGTVVEQSECPVICKVANDPQAMGSAITYARRYSLASILCVVTDDDDAEAAVQPTRTTQPANNRPAQSAPTPLNIDVTDWQLMFDACQDSADLNRAKKDVAAAKLPDDTFKIVWPMLNKRAKTLGCAYDKESKKFGESYQTA